MCTYVRRFKEEGRHISMELSLFVLVHNTNFMNKLKFNEYKKLKQINSLIEQIFLNLLNHPTFQSVERLVNLGRGREYFVGLSILFVYTMDPAVIQISGLKCQTKERRSLNLTKEIFE